MAVNTAMESIESSLQSVNVAKNEINFAVEAARTTINTAAENAINNLNQKVEQALAQIPNAENIANKTYVDNAIASATSSIVTDVFVFSLNSPDSGYSGEEAEKRRKLLWIDMDRDEGGLKYYNNDDQSWVHVPVAWT